MVLYFYYSFESGVITKTTFYQGKENCTTKWVEVIG